MTYTDPIQIAKNFYNRYNNYKIFLLSGDLGTGKTTFIKNYSALLGYTGIVQSPTFILERIYKINATGQNIHHIDLYRLESINELSELNIQNILNTDYIFIEWADKFADYLHEIFKKYDYLEINFDYGKDNLERKIAVAEKKGATK